MTRTRIFAKKLVNFHLFVKSHTRDQIKCHLLKNTRDCCSGYGSEQQERTGYLSRFVKDPISQITDSLGISQVCRMILSLAEWIQRESFTVNPIIATVCAPVSFRQGCLHIGIFERFGMDKNSTKLGIRPARKYGGKN